MKNLKLTLIGFTLLLVSCSDQLEYRVSRSFSNGSFAGTSSLEFQKFPDAIGTQKMVFDSQFIDGANVEDSFRKSIVGNTGEFHSSRWIEKITFKTHFEITWMKIAARFTPVWFRRRFEEYQNYNLYSEPSVVIHAGWPRWKLTLEKSNGELFAVYFDTGMNRTDVLRLGSSYQTSAAALYPRGPLKSQIESVPLQSLAGRRTLESDRIKILTQSNHPVISEDSQFFYSVEDQRFEQVQVYYYIANFMDWCERELKFPIQYKIEADTAVGYPERTNTAFYYQQKIRLGQGDGIAFAQMALDPTVVIHESFHSLIDAVARLSFQGEGGSLNEAYADFFTAVLLQNPLIGEVSYKRAPYKRTVQNDAKLQDKRAALYADSSIVSGLLWSLYKEQGHKDGLGVAWETLIRLTPVSDFADFKMVLGEVLSQHSRDKQIRAQKILFERGWEN